MINLVHGLFHKEQETKQALADFILRTDRLSIGSECSKFEQQFANWQGRAHTVLFNSGSSANLALIQALLNLNRLNPKDVTAFSAITWATNVMPIIQLGLTPIPIDSELTTLNSSSKYLKKALDQRPEIKAFFITNLLGFCSDLDVIKNVCEDRSIILIEDNCESLGTTYQGNKLGNFGLASTFSFFVGHHLSTIEGGAVCTDDEELDQMLRLVRAHGWDRNLSTENQAKLRRQHEVDTTFFANFTFYNLGYNLRPTEITGFLGQQELAYADEIISDRHNNFNKFNRALETNPDFIPLDVGHLEIISNFAMPVICKSAELANKYVNAFQDAQIEIRPIVGGSMPDQPFYRERYGPTSTTPNAKIIDRQGFYFGNHSGISDSDIKKLYHLAEVAPISSVS